MFPSLPIRNAYNNRPSVAFTETSAGTPLLVYSSVICPFRPFAIAAKDRVTQMVVTGLPGDRNHTANGHEPES